MEKTLHKIIVIVGPTASGKTDLAIKLAKKYKGEIVSADSRQIYRGMNIGTAKPQRDSNSKFRIQNSEFRSGGIPHHLIDIRNPNEEYSVAQYKKDSVATIQEIAGRGKLPILVGGTGLYIKAVIDNLKIPEVKANPILRQELEKESKEKGIEHLYNKLVKLDPEAAYIVDPKNPRRVIRALEIILLTNKPFFEQRKQGEKMFDTFKIGIALPKEKLKSKIERRVDLIIKNGLVKEVKELIAKYPTDLPAFDAIGYRETIDYFKGKIPLKEAIALTKTNTWQYAKRQITWFKADKEIKWIKNAGEAERLLRRFLGSESMRR